MQAMIKYLPGYHVFQVVFFRSIGTSLLCMVFLLRHGISLLGNKRGLLILRAIIGLSSMSMFFATLQRIPMGASVSLKYLSPVFTAIFAVIILKERVRWINWGFFVLALIGVLMLKGFDTQVGTLDLFLGVGGAMFAGLVYVIIRRIGNSEHPMVIVNYFMGLATILSGIAMIPFWKTPQGYEWLLLSGIGVLGYYAQVFLTKSLQVEQASKVAPVIYMELVYSLLVGFFWFEESYTPLAFGGIMLILLSMLLNVLFKAQPKEN